MTALGMTALHLRIAKFTHKFIICNWLPDHGTHFWYRYTEKVLYFLCLGQGKKLFYSKGRKIPNIHEKL